MHGIGRYSSVVYVASSRVPSPILVAPLVAIVDLGAAQALATCALHMVVTSLQLVSQAARCSRL